LCDAFVPAVEQAALLHLIDEVARQVSIWIACALVASGVGALS
jgi:hypothetical protein